MPRGRPKNKNAAAQKLLDALAFARIAQPEKTDIPYKNHCAIWSNWLLAFNGVLAAGHPIDEDLACCPHTEKLHYAIAQSTKTLNITELDNGSLRIKSDKFSATVPCLPFSDMVPIVPDQPCGQLTDRVRAGFNLIGGLAADNSQYVVTASILLRNGSMITTDRKMILEYWHGLELPTLVIPKAFATAIGKVDKELTSFGFSDNSVTVYFADGSWLKSQLYGEPWPEVDSILNEYTAKTGDIPKEFFEAIDAIEPFGENNVYLDGKQAKSHADDDIGAAYDCSVEINRQYGFNVKALKFLSKKINQIGFSDDNNKPVAVFFGDNLRGVLMGLHMPAMKPASEPVGSDDEIPY